jgi:hypothetical protein
MLLSARKEAVIIMPRREVPTGREGHPAGRWETIRYALESNSRTLRFCVIILVADLVLPALITVLVHR